MEEKRFSKKFDIFGGQFNETCVRMQTFQTIPMSDWLIWSEYEIDLRRSEIDLRRSKINYVIIFFQHVFNK